MGHSHRLEGLARAGALIVLVTLLACKQQGNAPPPVEDAGPPPPPPQLPLYGVRVGMTEEQLFAAFPAAGKVDACTVWLVGKKPPSEPTVPGARSKAHAECATLGDAGGATDGEFSTMMDVAEAIFPGKDDDRTLEQFDAFSVTLSQLRAMVRAGSLTEAELFQAANSDTAYRSVISVAAKLLDGGRAFVRPQQSRRPLCATLDAGCDDYDPEKIREYVSGGYTYGTLDGQARARCSYGACRGPFQRSEGLYKLMFLSQTGALAGLGMSRLGADATLEPDNPKSYATYTSRSKLAPKVARVGAIVGATYPAAEAYWAGAISLNLAPDDPAAKSASAWGLAIVWLKDQRVSRIILNIKDEEKLAELPATLEAHYKKAGTTAGTITTWELDGAVARLDIGAAAMLLVEER